jgi:hypothetical protein
VTRRLRVAYFGYGSLVNRCTRTGSVGLPARVRGWRRSWGVTGYGRCVALGIYPDPAGEVVGVYYRDRAESLEGMDRREYVYARTPVAVEVGPHRPVAFTYAYEPGRLVTPDRNRAIPLSYLECVLAGYLAMGGEAAAAEFVNTTERWGPILDDRRGWRAYERAREVPPEHREALDRVLSRHGLDRLVFAG